MNADDFVVIDGKVKNRFTGAEITHKELRKIIRADPEYRALFNNEMAKICTAAAVGIFCVLLLGFFG